MGTPAYRGRSYREFGRGCYEVHVDVPAHPFDPGMTAWFTTATGDDLDDTMERAADQALMEFYERHLPGLAGTPIALFPIKNEATWRGVSAWPLWVTPSVRRTTWGGCSWHGTPST
jgi:hypothetical protein